MYNVRLFDLIGYCAELPALFDMQKSRSLLFYVSAETNSMKFCHQI